MPRRTPILVKFGGELLEEPRRLKRLAKALVDEATRGPLVVVHGGGREVDAEMARLGIPKRAVDGLRLTDAATLDVVVGVLAGRVNTRLVAAIGAVGGQAVGLTGADAGIVRVRRARRYRGADGSSVDLGFVGVPEGHETPRLIGDLTRRGYTPVVASIGCDAAGRVFNVNADTLAGDLAPRIGARQLIIAGTTPGVLDPAGRTIPLVDDERLITLIRERQASAGMVAKLLACQAAHMSGVTRVEIVDGRRATFLDDERRRGVTRVTSQRTS
jgi:acetylglutamate kinase